MWAHNKWHFLYIICEMKFNDKTYGLNLLVANWVAITKIFSHIILIYKKIYIGKFGNYIIIICVN